MANGFLGKYAGCKKQVVVFVAMLLLEVSSFFLRTLERFKVVINNNFLKESLVLRVVVVHHSGFYSRQSNGLEKKIKHKKTLFYK